MHFHWQNLSDTPGRERRGFWYGRAWLHLEENGRRVVRFEWCHGKPGLALELRLDRDDREACLHVAGLGFSYHLGYDGLPAWLLARLPFSHNRTRYKYEGSERNIGVRVFDNAVWLSFWQDAMSWQHDDPWWYSGRLGLDDIANAIFGKVKYSTRDLEVRDIEIPMPERSYAAKATRQLARWTRPRWPWRPFSKERISVTVDIPGGIGMPGKGENSYDCGPDALFGMGTNAQTVEDAIGNVVASVFRTRLKYGGKHTYSEGAP